MATYDIRKTGVPQGPLVTYLDNVQTLVNELRTDHATSKTAADNIKTAATNMSLVYPTLATTASSVQFGSNITYTIAGAMYLKNATNNFWSLSGTTVTNGNVQKYLLCIDSSSAASVVAATQGASTSAVTLPTLPTTLCVLGILTVDASTAFVPGTTSLTNASITATLTNGTDDTLIGSAPAAISASAVTLSAVSD